MCCPAAGGRHDPFQPFLASAKQCRCAHSAFAVIGVALVVLHLVACCFTGSSTRTACSGAWGFGTSKRGED